VTVPDSDLVNLDVTIAEFIAPRIKAFRARNQSWPNAFENLEAWDAALAEMQHAFEQLALGHQYAYDHDDRVHHGLNLFRKHLADLWI
jgi:hypothetical protein